MNNQKWDKMQEDITKEVIEQLRAEREEEKRTQAEQKANDPFYQKLKKYRR